VDLTTLLDVRELPLPPVEEPRPASRPLFDPEAPFTASADSREPETVTPSGGGRSRLPLVAALLVVVLGAAGFGAWKWFGRSGASPQTGTLSVQSNPAGIPVFVDGVERGKTPLVVAEVASGIHEIRLVKPGFAELSLNKSVRAGRDETISAAMAKGEVVVTPTPARTGRGVRTVKAPETKVPETKVPGTRLPETKVPEPRRKDPDGPRNPYDDDPPTPGDRDKKKNPYD
jgi:hypothetical protein